MSGEEYRRAMDTLARESRMPHESAARIERQLLDAFATRNPVNVVPSPSMKTLAGRSWVAAAAAIILVASVAYLWRLDRPLVNAGRQPAPSSAAAESPASGVVTPSGFVDLPWTAGLPAFESGEIVRMDIPVASLPTYGIDISSGPGRGPVEADVLIGQDGFARAIRLVASSSRSTP